MPSATRHHDYEQLKQWNDRQQHQQLLQQPVVATAGAAVIVSGSSSKLSMVSSNSWEVISGNIRCSDVDRFIHMFDDFVHECSHGFVALTSGRFCKCHLDPSRIQLAPLDSATTKLVIYGEWSRGPSPAAQCSDINRNDSPVNEHRFRVGPHIVDGTPPGLSRGELSLAPVPQPHIDDRFWAL